MKKWEEEILQYFTTGYTNARTEGTTHKIKNIKRRSYGFRNRKRFRTRVVLECTRKLQHSLVSFLINGNTKL
ncbi:transposase [Alkalihalobacillus deserti]|uniref:transposase n=1 Tax=Alkalihalobacillus deserti TaxID=2879466 RepID=UPI001D1338BE|nr:transposase [Alkalihalobacillus deserti]